METNRSLVMNRTRSNHHANAMSAAASLHFYNARTQIPDQQQQQQQQHHHEQQQSSQQTVAFTNTAKLPIETVKKLIAAVSRRPNLWIRQHSGNCKKLLQKLWQEVSEETQIPADICRIKWGHLRDNFRKVFIRNTLSDETPTTWRFYNDMRFMEKSVAENIMRQSRYKERYWPEQNQHQLIDPMVPICTLKEKKKLDTESMQNFGIYTETDEYETKRIKLEPQDNSFLIGQQDSNLKKIYSGSVEVGNSPEPEPDDDDFDEDTATEENDQTNSKDKQIEKNNVFPLDIFNVDDDEDDDEHITHDNGKHNTKSHIVFNGNSETFSSIDDQSNNFFPNNSIKKTDLSNGLTAEQDSDRMFLLSLLPYLRNVDVSRKLLVRQKLQNVLIEELS